MTDGRADPEGRTDLPIGTVTFLRTDVEGSMALAHALGDAWDAVNARHLARIRSAIAAHGGTVVRTEGDAVFAAFAEAGAAAAAAVAAQRALHDESWPPGATVRVRMGLHSGEAHRAGDDYGGLDAGRAARVAVAAHGGQILLSSTTAALVADRLPDGSHLVDLGEHRLRDVRRPERLAQLSVAGLPDDFPAPRSAVAVVGSLPDRVTSFLGRDAELARIQELVREARLVTITGPGGIGKSSLAIEAARRLLPQFSDGAWFVPLADVDDPAAVPAAIAHGVGLYDGVERSAAAALLPYLADRSPLLVVDNAEQVVEAVASQVAAILQSSPGSRILVTSRAPLHVAGEHELPVRPLIDAGVDLFVERACAVRPDWDPGDDRQVIEDVVRLLDHLPLGIELAAARMSLLTPAVIRDRLTARLPLPGPGVRDAPARQRTLDATVAWSHDLLEPSRQTLLHELGVFEGGFDLEQVERVSPARAGADRLDDLLELADRSLIVAVPDVGDRVRFRLLRTIQTFALERLAADGRTAAVRRAHAEAFHALVRDQQARLNTSGHAAALDRVGPEVANVRAATLWAIEEDQAELALDLVADEWRFWHAFGLLDEGRRLTERALALPSAAPDSPARAWATGAAGSLAYWQADPPRAKYWYEEQRRIAAAVGDEACLADALFNLGHVAFTGKEPEGVQESYIDDVAARYRDLGDERGAARAAWAYSVLAMAHGRPEEAIAHLDKALAEFERLDDPQYHAMTVTSVAWTAFTTGDLPTAIRYALDGLLETYRMRDVGTTTISLHIGVLIGAMMGRLEDAAVIAGAFDAQCERYGIRPPAALEDFVKTFDPFEATRSGLAPEDYAAAYERGRRLSLDEAVATIIELGESALADPARLRAGGPA